MTVHTILKMGDARLLRVAQPVTAFDTPSLHGLVRDMLDTMRAANGAGLAAPQIGVDLQLVVFGTQQPNPRYPNRPLVPPTVLANPVITPLGRVPVCPRFARLGAALDAHSLPGLRSLWRSH
jgi:peptide deformylase